MVNRIAVLGLDNEDLSASTVEDLNSIIRHRVRGQDTYEVRPGKSLEEVKLVFGCIQGKASCMARVGRTLLVDKLLWGNVRKHKSAFGVTLKLFDVRTERVERFVSEYVSQKASLSKAIDVMTARLLAREPGQVRVIVKQQDVQVRLGGDERTSIGQGPVIFQGIEPGNHRLQVTKRGYATWSRTVAVRPNQTLSIRVRLKPSDSSGRAERDPTRDDRWKQLGDDLSVAEADDDSSRSAWRTAFWITTSAAIAFTGASVGFWVAQNGLTGDKEAEIIRLGQEDPSLIDDPILGDLFDPTADACSAAAADPANRAESLVGICNNADLYSALNIGFAVAAGVSAAVAGYLLYKAYIEDPSPSESASHRGGSRSVSQTSEPFWLVSPITAKGGGGLGLLVVY